MRAARPTRKFVLAIFAAGIIGGAGTAGPDPPKTAGQGGEAVVIAEPSTIDLGRVPTCSTFRWTLRLINTGAETKRVERIGTPGECSIGRLPGTAGDHLIPPYSLLEVEIAQRVGVIPGPIRQDIIALIEDHPPVEMLVQAEAVGFVSIEPGRINPAEIPEGRVKVRSRNGQPFRILRILPPFIEPPEGSPERSPEEASAEQTIIIDWDCWREADRPSSFALETDHPLCPWTLAWIESDPVVAPAPTTEPETEWDALVFGVPQAFDLGQIPTSTTHDVTFYLVNTGDKPRRVEYRPGRCGYPSLPDGEDIAPGQAIRYETRITSGTIARDLEKTVRIGVRHEGYHMRFHVRAKSISYITIEPFEIDFHDDPEPCIRVYSVDGQPFRIRLVFPMICGELPKEPAVEHFLRLDWQRWCESRHQRRMLITTDHPLCLRAYARLKCGPSGGPLTEWRHGRRSPCGSVRTGGTPVPPCR